MSAAASAKKPVASEAASEQAAAAQLQAYAKLMREAGSPDGHWNPEPDEQISGMVRHDVELSPNETKAIFAVKAHCLRYNPLKGRTAWGWTETGKPFRETELGLYFGWDEGNTHKWLKQPLAYGFIRRNEKTGQLGIGALVRGQAEPDGPPDSLSEVDLLVRTDKLPRYLAKAVHCQLTETEKLTFLTGWRSIQTKGQQELNTQKQQIYDRTIERLDEHCKTFGGKLPKLQRKTSKAVEEEAAENDPDLSVRTSSEADSVQDTLDPLYKAANGFVRTSHIRNESKAKQGYESSSSLDADSGREHPTTTSPQDPEKLSPQKPSEITKVATGIAENAVVTATIAEFIAPPDEVIVVDLIAACRTKEPSCTVEEICHFVKERGPLVASSHRLRSPMAYLKTSVVNCISPESIRQHRASVKEKSDRHTAAAAVRLDDNLLVPHWPIVSEAAEAKAPEPPPKKELTPEERTQAQTRAVEIKEWLANNPNANEVAIQAYKKELKYCQRMLRAEAVLPAAAQETDQR
jgi:hypothetical protein